MDASSHGSMRACVATLLMVVALASAGCCRWNWRGDGFGDDTGKFAQKMRPPADESKFSGLDARSREIERDLGVR
jgi:hypothetical protein